MADRPPFAVGGLDHVVIRARDVARLAAFWRDVLGCEVEKVQDKLGLTQMRAGRSLVDLVDVEGKIGRQGGAPPGAEGHNMNHFCLRVDPFDGAAIQAHLKAHGVEVGAVEQRYGAEGDGPSLYFTDPEGNTIELKGPPDP